MIVTCEECSTSFQLDETRIPASGARVRCSRCKHAFFLPHPSASQAAAVHAVAADAAADPVAVAPGAADDLSVGMTDADDGFGEPAPEFDEEEEWQFSEEVRVAGDEPDDDLDDPIGAGDALFDGELSAEEREEIFAESSALESELDAAEPGEVSSAGLDVEPISEEPVIAVEASVDEGLASGLELDVPDPPAETADTPVRDESGFGTVDDFSSLMEEDPAEAGLDLAGEDVGELDDGLGSSPDVGTYVEQGATDDLGDPESWDLVGGDDAVAARPSLASVSRSFTDGIRDLAEPVSAEDFFGGGESDYDDPAALEGLGLPKAITVSMSVAARTIGWAVTLGLIGAFLFFGGRAELGRWSEATQQARVGAFEVATEDSGWVETSRAGYVLRFGGRVRNAGDRPLWPGTVQLVLLDGSGERILASPLQAGAPVDPRVLREAPAEQLASTIETAIRRFASEPLASGEERRFEAVVPEAELPAEARRVLLEVGEPRTGRAVASVSAAAGGPAERAEGLAGVQAPDEPGLSP